ncbi:MAG TPA: hypothetical protein VGF00_16140, partial [Acidimicrobiia bacterium]
LTASGGIPAPGPVPPPAAPPLPPAGPALPPPAAAPPDFVPVLCWAPAPEDFVAEPAAVDGLAAAAPGAVPLPAAADPAAGAAAPPVAGAAPVSAAVSAVVSAGLPAAACDVSAAVPGPTWLTVCAAGGSMRAPQPTARTATTLQPATCRSSALRLIKAAPPARSSVVIWRPLLPGSIGGLYWRAFEVSACSSLPPM